MEAVALLVPLMIGLAVLVLLVGGMWKAFAKAGQPGWASIIPIYGNWIMIKIGNKPGWWLLAFIAPTAIYIMGVAAQSQGLLMFSSLLSLASWVFSIMLSVAIAKAFGKGAGFGVGLALLPVIFWPILGFGSAQYLGANAPAQQQPQQQSYTTTPRQF